VVDLGADFRLPADDYEQWYGEAHAAPELLDRFAFGLPELYRDDIAGAAHVAAPGCYPTARRSRWRRSSPRPRGADRHRGRRGLGGCRARVAA
jgi:hypothetical protein